MKLKKAQREILLTWVAEGLESDEINQRAATFKPRFKVTRQQVDHYRKTRKVKLKDLRDDGEFDALTSGLAKRDERVTVLKTLADTLLKDLTTGGKLWLDQVKGIGGTENYERVEYQEFNSAEVAQLRGILEDIAHEMGDRRPGVVVNNTFQFDVNEWKKEREKRLKAIRALQE
jgi:hypothetical protein